MYNNYNKIHNSSLEIAQNITLALIKDGKISIDQIPEQFKKFYKMVNDCIAAPFDSPTIISDQFTIPKFNEAKRNYNQFNYKGNRK